MQYNIIGDSCTDLPMNLKKSSHYHLVPLTIQVGDEMIVDDITFDQKALIEKMKKSDTSPKSACPSPEAYASMYDFEGDVYVVTISSQLSGSYNSAELAKTMYLEEHPDKKIAVIDSKAASITQGLLVIKLMELIEQGLSFDEVTEKIGKYRDDLDTIFVLESIDNLRKSGRLSHLQAILCSALNIKPVMGATPEGTIRKIDQARGIEKAVKLLIKIIETEGKKANEKILGIAHCNHYERALLIKDELMKRVPFKDCIIVETAGISSTYANDGGVVVCY